MVEPEDIYRIKESVDLVALVRSRGIDLTKNGKGYKGICPFHEDDDPSFSVNPDRNLWNCFGCGTGGDAIRFVELIDKVDFKEAVRRLMENAPSASETRSTQTTGIKHRTEDRKRNTKETAMFHPLAPAHIKVLGRVIDFYHTAFCEDPRGAEYLAGRGIVDTKIFEDHKIGLAGGTLLSVLPDEGDIKKQLQEIGILSDKGKEHFYGCITFPLYDLAGNPAGLYGRRIMGKGADHLYSPGPRRGIFNRQAAIRDKEIILTEAVIDAVTLMTAGVGNTIPCYGVNGLTDDHLNLFKQHTTGNIRICFDNDDAGRRGREAVAARLRAEGFTTEWINLPEGQDINSFFLLTAGAGERFAALLTPAVHQPEQQAVKEEKVVDPVKREEKDPCSAGREESTTTAEGIACTIDKRHYQVRAIGKPRPSSRARSRASTAKRTASMSIRWTSTRPGPGHT